MATNRLLLRMAAVLVILCSEHAMSRTPPKIPPGYKTTNFYTFLKVDRNFTLTQLRDRYLKMSGQVEDSNNEAQKDEIQGLIDLAYDMLRYHQDYYDKFLERQGIPRDAPTKDLKHFMHREEESRNGGIVENHSIDNQWKTCRDKCIHGLCMESDHGELDVEPTVVCECNDEQEFSGEWCDEPRKIPKKCAKKCKKPNQCIGKEQIKLKVDRVIKNTTFINIDRSLKWRIVEKIRRINKIGTNAKNEPTAVCFCSLGNEGKNCDKRCKPGYFGLYCESRCDADCTKTCNRGNGTCECRVGFEQERASSICIQVPATEANCEENCKSEVCEGSKCICSYAQEPYCDVECSNVKPHPRYGKTCENACGGCKVQPCDKETGVCRKKKSSSRCIYKAFVGEKCELGEGITTSARLIVRFTEAKAQFKRDRVAIILKAIGASVRTILGRAIPVLISPTRVSLLEAYSALSLARREVKLKRPVIRRHLLQGEEEAELTFDLLMPDGGNSSLYQDITRQVMNEFSDNLESNPSLGISVDKKSFQVSDVKPFKVDLPVDDEVDSMPMVIGGIILAAAALVCTVFALALTKRQGARKQRNNTGMQAARSRNNRFQGIVRTSGKRQISAQHMKAYTQTTV